MKNENEIDILTAACIAHRAICGNECTPENHKLHGYCQVCGVPWPCETAKKFMVLAPTPPVDDVCECGHPEMNRQTANHIAQNQSLHKEAQDVLEEDIFSALQIAEKRAVICTKFTPKETPKIEVK